MLKNIYEKALNVLGIHDQEANQIVSRPHNISGTTTIDTGIDLNPVSKLIWKEIRHEGKKYFMGNLDDKKDNISEKKI